MKKYAIIYYVHTKEYGTSTENSKTLFEYEKLGEKDTTFGFRYLINSRVVKTSDPGLKENKRIYGEGPIIDIDSGFKTDDFIFEAKNDASAILIYEVS